MGRHGRDSRPGNGKAFIPLDYDLLNSDAYISLSYSSRAALFYFLAKVKLPLKDHKRYTTPFPFTYGEAKRYGFTTRTFSRVIQELMSNGFIDPHERGGLRGLSKSDNQFKLSERWRSYGSASFVRREWRQFI